MPLRITAVAAEQHDDITMIIVNQEHPEHSKILMTAFLCLFFEKLSIFS